MTRSNFHMPWAFWIALLSASVFNATLARAHCDGMDGPVVKAARKALAEENVNYALIWVQPGHDNTITSAFEKTLVVRRLSPEAQELADLYFFETLVRLHRAAEGAPYTGLKPADRDLDPVIVAADRSIKEGSVNRLLSILPHSTHAEVRQVFEAVAASKTYAVDDVRAGREFVSSYVRFIHTAERLHGNHKCDNCAHSEERSHENSTSASSGPVDGEVTVSGETTVRELVGRYSRTRPVFEEHGIDYCCGGTQTLAEASRKHGLDLEELVVALERALHTAPGTSNQSNKDWYAVPLNELVEHIVSVHHSFLRKEFPRLKSLEEKVLRAHGESHGNLLHRVHNLLAALDAELTEHLVHEEKVVFPQLLAAAHRVRDSQVKQAAAAGEVRSLIDRLEREHAKAGALLDQLRDTTSNYNLPEDACPTFKALYDGLQKVESDLHEHIHLENNVLFARVLKPEG